MATKQHATDPEKAEEARHLAEEAQEARKEGDREEAEFLAEEARELDPDAAAEVLDHKRSAKTSTTKSSDKPAAKAEKGSDTASSTAHDKPSGSHSAQTTTDHDTVQKWAEARGGRPSVVRATEGEEGDGILRFDFREPDDALEEVDWEAFFKTFDDRKLALLYQETTKDGGESRFFKFVHRDA